jgi:alpha-tubulin suppressor-like RCC1 family protein
MPIDVVGLSGAVAIAAGSRDTAVMTGGSVKYCGARISKVPVDVPGLRSGMASVVLGSFHGCALSTAGGVKCWGSNNYGELGDNTGARSDTPVNVFG